MTPIHCSRCGARDAIVLLSGLRDRYAPQDRYRIVRCRSCRIQMTYPVRDSYPDDYGPYRDTGEEPRPIGLRAAVSRVFQEKRGSATERLRLLLPYLAFRAKDKWMMRCRDGYVRPFRRRGRLLDIGSGRGHLLALWRDQHARCVGVEPHRPSAAAARSALGVDVRAGTLEEQAFPSEGFDVVTLAHVLEHVNSPDATLREVARLLHPGGEVLIWVPNYDSWLRPVLGRTWFPYEVPRHRWHFRPGHLVELLRAAGLRPVEIACDPNDWVLQESLRDSAFPAARLLNRWWLRLLILLACLLFRRTDIVRVRARKR